MFNFKVIATTFPTICVVVGAFLLFQGNSGVGGLLVFLAFISFVLALISKSYRTR